MDFSAADGPLSFTRDGARARLELNRPALRNALDDTLIGKLAVALDALHADPPRLVLLSGTGPLFCAGADATWMRRLGEADAESNRADALALAAVLGRLDTLPCPVVARVQGGAYGGGLGLLACCDVVVAADDCRFSFAEVRLGLTPATIAPFVVAKTGLSAARALFLTAERFDAPAAQRFGLVHRIVPPTELDGAVESVCAELLKGGPQAQAATKQLLRGIAPPDPAVAEFTAGLLADLRSGAEAREGLAAFLEKRPAAWTES